MTRLRVQKTKVQQQADFFDSLGRDYLNTVQADYDPIYRNTGRIMRQHVKGDVLDIGSGGVELFQTDGKYVFYDVSRVLLNCHKKGNRNYQACGESSTLPFKNDSFDTVVFHFSIHHFAQNTFGSTLKYVSAALKEATRICRPGGNMLVAENTMVEGLEFVQALGYPVMNGMLGMLNKPPAFFFSEKRLRELFIKTRLGDKYLTVGSVYAFKIPSKLLVLPVTVRFQVNPVTVNVFIVEVISSGAPD